MKLYPEKYWHCYVKLEGKTAYAVANDLQYDVLKSTILVPWHSASPFVIAGKIISRFTTIEEVRITQTNAPKDVLAQRFLHEKEAQGIIDMATDLRRIPILKGTDYTYELLFAGRKEEAREADPLLVEHVCSRIGNAARIISNRPRTGKQSYLIRDEYDVQDLLHCVLRAYIKYSVQEDPLPKVAGARSSRADISIEELGILIEVKFVRSPSDQKTLFDDFSRDLVLYPSWSHLKTLLYVIYNSSDLADAEALEKLSGPKEIGGRRFDVRIILA